MKVISSALFFIHNFIQVSSNVCVCDPLHSLLDNSKFNAFIYSIYLSHLIFVSRCTYSEDPFYLASAATTCPTPWPLISTGPLKTCAAAALSNTMSEDESCRVINILTQNVFYKQTNEIRNLLISN